MEKFIEETSKIKKDEKTRRKYYVYATISYVAMALAIFSVFFTPVFIGVKDGHVVILTSGVELIINIVSVLLTFGLSLFLHFYFRKKKNKLFIEYDYVFNGEKIILSAIYNEEKRVFLDKIDAKSIIKLGKITSGSYKKILSDPTVKKEKYYSQGNTEEDKKLFYIVYHGVDGKKAVTIETTEKFIVAVLKVAGRDVVEEDYE